MKKLINLLLLILLLSSCKKETLDNDLSSSQENSLCQQNFSDLGTMADEVLRDKNISYKLQNPFSLLSTCVTVDDTTGTKVNFEIDIKDTITIDFGSTNCLCNDGRFRRGKINFIYTGLYRTPGTQIEIEPVNYFVNDNQVSGLKIITNQGSGSNYILRHTIEVFGTITKPDGTSIIWNCNRNRDWISGDTLFMNDDDAYSITGEAWGQNSNGVTFTSEITSSLIRKFDVNNPLCRRYFVEGKLEITPQNKPTRLIDFGQGTCDNIATVTIQNQSWTIQLN